MNAWPTLQEWIQFGGTLALQILIVFAVAKLVALRVRSAQGRRALWQITLLAMLFVTVGELNGVRGWLRLPEKKISPPVVAATQKVIVTFKDIEPGPDMFSDFAAAPVSLPPAPRPSSWQERAVWPALLWAACAALVLFRLVIAQGLALRLRFMSHRSSGQPCPLNIGDTEETADKAVRNSARACRNSDPALRQRLGHLAQSLGLRRKVVLLTSQRTVAPFTFGVWRPVIVLPRNFTTTFTREQQDAALAHELAHVAGFDSAWRTLSQCICAVLWWHPLVWLAKRELDHASELVADEASLLVANGPDRLAECLLACAKELRRPALAGWLGMDGGGFRSALGKRVTRLLQLNPHARLSRPVPWYLRLLAPVVCAALLWLGMAAVMKPGAPRGGAWRASILGSAFAAVAVELKEQSTPQEDHRRAEATRLFQNGKLYYETGRLEEARTNLQAALKLEPTNQTATWYLDAIGKVQSPTNSIMRPVSSKRQAIYDKLRRIRLSEWGPLDNLPLNEVIRSISDEARRRDIAVSGRAPGINFLISSDTNDAAETDPNGLPIAADPAGSDLINTKIRLGTKLHDLSVGEVLNIVMKIADRKIKYSVEDYGVVISSAANEPTPLHTRFFHMNSNDFQRVLQSVPRELTNASAKSPDDVPFGRRVDSERTNRLHFLTEVTPTEVVIPGMRNWFKSMGVDVTKAGKAVFYNDKLGMLMVRATLEDLDKVEKGLQTFGIKPSAKFLDGRAATGEPRNVSEQDQIEAAKLVQNGKHFYEAGQLHAARTNLQAALLLQPDNQGALYFLDLVNTRELAVRAKLKDLKVPMDTPTNQVQEAMVVVRATPAELDTVGKAIQLLNMTPPQLTIRVKVLEVERKGGDGLGFDWFPGTIVTNTVPTGVPPMHKTLPGNHSDAIPASMLTSGLRTKEQEPATPTITGILTDQQFRTMVKTLENRGGTDLLSAPEVTTMSGRQAQIKVVDIKYIVTELSYSAFTTNTTRVKKPSGNGVTISGADDGLNSVITPIAQPFEIGPVIDVIPYVEADGYTITMTVLPTMREFLGYDDPGDFSITVSNRVSQKTLTQPVPLPKFRLRQVAATARIWDGQTLMLSAGSARTFQRKPGTNSVITTNYTEKELIYFITPRLIDPAGNPLHSDDEFPERHKTVPGQRNGKP